MCAWCCVIILDQSFHCKLLYTLHYTALHCTIHLQWLGTVIQHCVSTVIQHCVRTVIQHCVCTVIQHCVCTVIQHCVGTRHVLLL